MPVSKWRQKGNKMDPSCPKPVFASASKHLGSVNTKPLPVFCPSYQLVCSKQLTGKLQASRDSSSWAICPIIWPLVDFRVTGKSSMLAEVCRLSPGFWEKAECLQLFLYLSTLPISVCHPLQVSSSMEMNKARASIRLNYFSNHITFGKLLFAKWKHLQLRNVTSQFKNFSEKSISSNMFGWWQPSKHYLWQFSKHNCCK